MTLFMILLTTILIYLLTIIISGEWKRFKLQRLYKDIASRYWCLPLLGHSYLLTGSDEDRTKSMIQFGEESYKYGGILLYWHGYKSAVVVGDPVIAEMILKNCLDKGELMYFLKSVIGNGSVFAPVDIWRPRRKVLIPAFGTKNIDHFFSVFVKQSGIMVQQLEKQVGKGAFSFSKYTAAYAMDSICESSLGTQVNSQQLPHVPLLLALDQVNKVQSQRVALPWLQNDYIFRLHPLYSKLRESKELMISYVENIIKTKKLAAENNTEADQTGPKTFLELMINSAKTAKGFQDTELLEECLVLFIAGTDTTSVGISFAAVLLSQYQNVQDRCYEELMEVFGDSDRPVCTEDLPQLKYLDAVIKESLRLYPPGPFISRSLDKDLTLPSGVVLQAGLNAFVSIYAIHRNPKYWGDDADQFRPERFLDAALRHPSAFMPFSLAPRGCIGYQYAMMSMKTTLATLLRSYRLLLATNEDGTPKKPLRPKFDMIIKDVGDFQIQLERRSRSKK